MDIDATALRRAIGDRFDVAEIERLCYDLGIDHENLKGGTKYRLIDSLFAHCYRRGKVAELIAQCIRERPRFLWDFPMLPPTNNLSGDHRSRRKEHLVPLVTQPITWPYYSVTATAADRIEDCIGVPLGYSDARIEFDITNPNKLPIRISSIFVDVASFSPAAVITCSEGMKGGLVEPVIWACTLADVVGRYSCTLSTSGREVTCQLPSREMMTFWVTLDYPPPGLYKLSVSFAYRIGSSTNVMRVRGSDFTFGFFNVAEHEKAQWGLG